MDTSPQLLEKVAQYPAIALVLQGGGALGAYQCGVYQALNEAGIRPNWYAGISIGAINAAIIAGNRPQDRIERLRDSGNDLRTRGPRQLAGDGRARRAFDAADEPGSGTWAATMSALAALWQGQRGFFTPWPASPFMRCDGTPQATSFYDTTPLLATLERLVDFDRINDDRTVRLTVGVTDVESGNFRYSTAATPGSGRSTSSPQARCRRPSRR